jgi:hypothetical protein
MMVPVKEIPAGGLQLSPRFWASDDVAVEAAAWNKAVERRRPYLERAIALAPDGMIAEQARAVLNMK